MAVNFGNEGTTALAAVELCLGTCLGAKSSRLALRRRLIDAFANSGHRWMWDYYSLTKELAVHGFIGIKRFTQGECADEMFLRPERDHQFGDKENPYGLSIECLKPR